MPTTDREKRLRSVESSIRRLTKERKVAPTIRELADDLGRSPGPVHKDLCSLQKENRVTWEQGTARTLRLVR